MLGANLMAQDIGVDMPFPDESIVTTFPWYNNNDYLENYLTQRGFYNSNLRTNCPTVRYEIPVVLHLYRNDAWGPATNVGLIEILDYFNEANAIFINANADIQFYVEEIREKNG